MKRIIILMLLSLLSLNAWSIPISTVGGVDNFLSSSTLASSSEADELAWVANELGLSLSGLSFDAKEDSADTDWQSVDTLSNVFAYELSSDPAYYLLKLGTGNSTADTHYLFENLAELSWAVIDFGTLDFGDLKFNLGRISHVSEFNSTVSVPEPSALILLGLAFLTFAFSRKKS